MKAAVIKEKEILQIEHLPVPGVVNDEVLIKVMACGICGTDIHIYMGDYKGEYPIIPGHEFSGIVKAIGPEVKNISEGERVVVEPNLSCGLCYNCMNNLQNFCENWQGIGVTRAGGMAQYVTVPAQAVFPIGDLSFEEASFVEPLSCVVHGVDRLKSRLGDKVLLLGAGPIGLLLLQNLHIYGCSSIDVVDIDQKRLEIAKKMGAAKVYTDTSALKEESYHIVVDATGVSSLLEKTLQYVRPSGKILWFGVPHVNEKVTVQPFHMFEKELTIMTSYTSCRNTWQTLQLLQSGRINVKDLISHKLPLDKFQRGIDIIRTHSEPVMKILIMPNS